MNQNAARKRARLDQGPVAGNLDTNKSDALMKRILARVNDLEGKCARLETKCRYLESQQQLLQQSSSFAERVVSSIVSHIDSKFRTIESTLNAKLKDLDNSSRWLESLHKNQEWKYNVLTIPTSYWASRGFDEDYVEAADSFLEDIEAVTCAMRRGECADSYVHLEFGERFDDTDNVLLTYDEVMQSHWTELVDALGQYHWFLNRSSTRHDDSSFTVSDVQIPSELCYLLERVLPMNHFKRVTFQNNCFGRFGISLAIKCVESNPKLVDFMLSENEIETLDDAQKLCQAVNTHPALKKVSLKQSCEAFSFDILRSIMHDDCKLECIDLSGNGIRTNGSRYIADFLAKDPSLRELSLKNNHLNDEDAEELAEALKTNTNLKTLILRGNSITDRGVDALRKVVADPSSLNSIGGCNHSCQIDVTEDSECASINECSDPKINRGDKIYRALSAKNATVHSYGAIVNLPTALESIQNYAKYSIEKKTNSYLHQSSDVVPALSTVYEVIRNKAPDMYDFNSGNATTDMEVDTLPSVSKE